MRSCPWNTRKFIRDFPRLLEGLTAVKSVQVDIPYCPCRHCAPNTRKALPELSAGLEQKIGVLGKHLGNGYMARYTYVSKWKWEAPVGKVMNWSQDLEMIRRASFSDGEGCWNCLDAEGERYVVKNGEFLIEECLESYCV